MTDAVTGAGERPLALAEQALVVVLSDPDHGERLATRALEDARRVRDPVAASLAQRAIGIAAREQDDLGRAERHLRAALRIASRHHLGPAAGGALAALASVQFLKGQAAVALATADRAAGMLTGNDLAVLRSHQATMLLWMGRPAEALDRYALALRVFRLHADLPHQAIVYGNRGLLHLHSGALAAAVRDLRRSEQLHRELGDHRWVAYVNQHLGMAFARRGDLVAALAAFDRADTTLLDLGAADPLSTMDRIEALLSARLLTEARTAAEDAVEQLVRHQDHLYVGRARLLQAEVALQQGDREAALAAARAARRSLRRQGQQGHVVLCDYIVLRATWPRSAVTRATLARTVRVADALAAARCEPHATDARLLAARTALELGQQDVATAELATCQALRRHGSVELRSRAWHATALLRLSAGDRRGAEVAVHAGLSAIERHQTTLAATELRAHASGHGTELAALGLELALADGRAERILTWSERWRARALHLRPRRVSADPVLAEQLDRLRTTNREIDHLLVSGGDTRRLVRGQLALEQAIRQRARVTAVAAPTAPGQVTPVQLRGQLAGSALVQYVEFNDMLWAVVLTRRHCRVVAIGDAAPVRREIQLLRFGLRRLAMTHAPRALSIRSARLGAAQSAARLSELLIRPLQRDIDGRRLVIIPTASLHSLPWAALPTLAGVPVTVAPSATIWHRCMTQCMTVPSGDGGPVALCAGPDLTDAEKEVAELAGIYPDALTLTGPDARVQRLLHALDGAGLGHIAAHGRFRSDNVLFSSLRMHDGELTVYDLESLSRPPALLVLAACDVGMSKIQAGDELMGVAAEVLSMGTRTVVATLLPVPDDRVRHLMGALHQRLRDGEAPADALVRARADVQDDSPDPLSGFACLGAAWPTPGDPGPTHRRDGDRLTPPDHLDTVPTPALEARR
jgi:CHAT domain-containing protein/tetratricopeptide (TPR) repeat protein